MPFIRNYTFLDCVEQQIEASNSYATSANIYQTTRHHIVQDYFLNRNQHLCAKLAYLVVMLLMAGVVQVVRADY